MLRSAISVVFVAALLYQAAQTPYGLIGCVVPAQVGSAYRATLYGYPLVTMAVKMKAMTTRAVIAGKEGGVDSTGTGFNRVVNYGDIADHRLRLIPSPNADTLYSIAWFDLRNEPVVMITPNFVNDSSRFYIWQLLDMQTNVIASISPRTHPESIPLNVVLIHTTSSSNDTVPTELLQQPQTRVVKSTSSIVWLIGRTLVAGVGDLPAARAVQTQLRCIGLHAFLNSVQAAPKINSMEFFDHTGSNVPTDVAEFFTILAWTLKQAGIPSLPPHAVDALTNIGYDFDHLVFDISKVSWMTTLGFNLAEKVLGSRWTLKGISLQSNLWGTSKAIGKFEEDFELRAVVSKKYLGGNLAEDSLYYVQRLDSLYRPLHGDFRYAITFTEPLPVRGFWSLCAYDEDHFFEKNEIGRYTIGTATPDLGYGEGRSVRIFMASTPPTDSADMQNWLPVPRNKFSVMLRVYWPEETFLNASYFIPSLQRL